MSGMNVLKVGPDRIIGSRDMGERQVAPGKPSSPGLRYLSSYNKLLSIFGLSYDILNFSKSYFFGREFIFNFFSPEK